MKKLHISLAYIYGVSLPIMEIIRRRTNFGSGWNYIDDFIIGALLIWAAFTIRIGKPYGDRFLCGAWGALCGGLYYSFTSQLTVTSDVSGFSNDLVILVKGILFLGAIISFVMSIHAIETSSDQSDPRPEPNR